LADLQSTRTTLATKNQKLAVLQSQLQSIRTKMKTNREKHSIVVEKLKAVTKEVDECQQGIFRDLSLLYG
jgi:hypothetical protein